MRKQVFGQHGISGSVRLPGDFVRIFSVGAGFAEKTTSTRQCRPGESNEAHRGSYGDEWAKAKTETEKQALAKSC